VLLRLLRLVHAHVGAGLTVTMLYPLDSMALQYIIVIAPDEKHTVGADERASSHDKGEVVV
jgi:hypothetical protein